MDTPIYDAHCWLQTPDGSIIDPHFYEYDMVCKEQNIPKTKHYCEAPIEVQCEIMKSLASWMKQCFEIIPIHACPIIAFSCFRNAYVLKKTKYPDAKLVVGSMGFGHPNDVWWYFGDPSWGFTDDFLRNP